MCMVFIKKANDKHQHMSQQYILYTPGTQIINLLLDGFGVAPSLSGLSWQTASSWGRFYSGQMTELKDNGEVPSMVNVPLTLTPFHCYCIPLFALSVNNRTSAPQCADTVSYWYLFLTIDFMVLFN